MPTQPPHSLRSRLALRIGRFLGVSDLSTTTQRLEQQVDALRVEVGSMAHLASADPQPSPLAPVAVVGATPGEVYSGYSADDLWVFDGFPPEQPLATPGYVTDFIGTKTRTSSLWNEVRHLDGQVMGRPVPHDLFEAVEWIGLLKAVVSAQNDRFAIMELGAGLGPWLVAGAVAARSQGLHDLHLLGVEADPGRFDLMRQHFLDNDLDPKQHELICAAVGVEKGHARWPRITDPANAAGARPVREVGGGLDQDDVAYIPHTAEDYIDVEILPFEDLLSRESSWDLVHVDVQGWEAKLIAACTEILTARVRWMIIGTHSRLIDGQVIEILHRAGWVLEHEKPTRFRYDPAQPSLDQMTEVDGVQVWQNPHLG